MCNPSFFAPENISHQLKTIPESQNNFFGESHNDFLAGIEGQRRVDQFQSENEKKSTEK
jgi:hypothetical protein